MTVARLPLLRQLVATVVVLSLAVACAGPDPATPGLTQVESPPERMQVDSPLALTQVDLPPDLEPTWLAARGKEQLDSAAQIKAFHDFRFEDRLGPSGITFMHRVVDDVSRTFVAAHYDHGDAIAAADVDNDGLSDLYFVNQVGMNELWRNLGQGKFEDITTAAGVGLPDRIGVAATFADFDNDGDADLYATSVRGGNTLLENDGGGHFKDITAAAGLEYSGHSSGAAFFDYDKDGLLDLYVANVGKYTSDKLRSSATVPITDGQAPGELSFYGALEDAFAGHLKPERDEASRLYHNLGGGKFTDGTAAMGLVDETWSGDVGVVDANVDGWPDLYVLNMQGNDEYYENGQGQRFVKRSREVFPKTPWGSMGIAQLDYNQDGRQDIYVTDMHSDMASAIDIKNEKRKSLINAPESMLRTDGASIFGNALYRSEGPDVFTEVSDATGTETLWPWGASAGDVNADGFEDLFVTAGMGFPFRYAINSLLLNEAGATFRDSEFILGVEPRRDGRYAKSWMRLACAGADAGNGYCGDPAGDIEIRASLSSRSSVLVDLENDGDLDIVTADLNDSPMVLVSNLSEANPDLRYLKVHLTGTLSNRDGLGAVVKVFVGDRILAQIHDGKSGYLAQSSLPLFFGLDQAAAADRIEVDWPSGATQVMPGPIAANQLLEIRE